MIYDYLHSSIKVVSYKKDVMNMNKWLRMVLIIFFSVVFVVSGYMVIDYTLRSRHQANTFRDLADMVDKATPTQPQKPVTTTPSPEDEPVETEPPTEPGPLPEYIEVSKLNPDMVGWIRIEDTKVNYPVMHKPDEKDAYLHRDFYGEYSYHGCLYAQEECSIDPASDNITIYGHNMNDGSMFAALTKYSNKSFWETHRYITFDTLMEHHTYEVFAVFTTTASKGQGFTYHQFINAKDQAEFDDFISDCKIRNFYDTGITPEYGDKLITLSTCEYSQKNGRFVVVAKRIS